MTIHVSTSEGPTREGQRLAALQSYGVLDQPSIDAIDALVRVTSASFGTPIALVSLVDERRQWFLSAVGLAERETPREVAFCAHAIKDTGVFEVPDALADERFAENPLVLGGPKVRFYAGAPLLTREGLALGTLCVIDERPRALSEAQRKLLEELSVVVMSLIEARRAEMERRDIEARARENEALLALAAEVAGLGHWRLSVAEGRVQWSDEVFRIHGRDPSEGPPSLESAVDFYHPDDRATVEALVSDSVASGKPFTFDLRIVRPNGEVRHVHSAGRALMRDGKCEELFGVLLDTTDRERLREQMVRNERLVTTGTLAAGVGHEINNPLTYTLANLDMALDEVREVAGASPSARMREIAELLAEAREGAERIRKIVRGLRAFAREEAAATHTELRDVVEISINMAMHEIRQRATLISELDPVPPVLADEARLSQVVVNLLVNAAQSFSEADVTKNRIWIRTRAVRGAVVIEVEDNGSGIPPSVLPRIFDPFFTTKPVGQGTGLGLAISQSVVANLGGELRCQSRVGEGTVFRVQLPLIEVALASVPPPVSSKPRGRRGKLLIIDDEETILRAMTRLLAREHDVRSVSDSREGLALLKSGEAFDLVFCDLMMPHLNGMDVFRALEHTAPDQARRVVFMTGGVSEALVRDFLEGVSNDRLEKPFTPQGLIAMARRHVGVG